MTARLGALLLAAVLGLAATGCSAEWEVVGEGTGEPVIVAGTEEEQRIMDREERADEAAAVMVLMLLLVGPMALTAVAIAIASRGDG
ncbi:MAG TPA: hypothetical protein VF045_03680 [Acidimicrobiales bacterium]